MKILKQNLIIPTTTSKLISESKDLFNGWIDSDFANWGLNNKQPKTKEIELAVLEMDKDATFREIFTSPETQCLTQSQIIKFVETHREHLRTNGYATFFLFKENGEFYVAGVRGGGHLDVRVGRFASGSVWVGGGRRRVVVPQLSLKLSDTPDSLALSPSETLTLTPLGEAIEIVKKAGYKVIKEV